MKNDVVALPDMLDATEPHPALRKISEQDAARFISTSYGLDVKTTKLASEKEACFRADVSDGRTFLCKIGAGDDAKLEGYFQTGLLRHLQEHSISTVPKAEHNRHGEWLSFVEFEGIQLVVRLATFLEGQFIGTALSSIQCHDLGAAIAALDVALKGFQPQTRRPSIVWDVQNCDRLLCRSNAVQDHELRQISVKAIEHYLSTASHAPDDLQVIHNDVQPSNALSTANGIGFIDFGDAVIAPYWQDLAICASYYCTGSNWERQIVELFAGYASVIKLDRTTIALALHAALARQALTVIITHNRAIMDQSNARYILRNEPASRAGLIKLANNRNGIEEMISGRLVA
jgi:hydroxylysine kinase